MYIIIGIYNFDPAQTETWCLLGLMYTSKVQT